LVEEHDVNAPDPLLLIELKSMRNTVPVPAHWLQKRKYLQGKRGFLKPPFKLPPYIEATGISKMRENRLDLLSDKSMKQKQRERMRPKAGGLEIAYDILHDAFARHQTRPDNLTGFGDLYFEGKERMLRFRKFKPGFVSDRLKKALGMTPRYRVVSPSGVLVRNQKEDVETGEQQWYNVQELKYGQYVVWDGDAGVNRIKISAPVTGFVWLTSKDNKEEKLKRCDVEDPPPWLINMQRFGPRPFRVIKCTDFMKDNGANHRWTSMVNRCMAIRLEFGRNRLVVRGEAEHDGVCWRSLRRALKRKRRARVRTKIKRRRRRRRRLLLLARLATECTN